MTFQPISREGVSQMIAVHQRADPYSPYGRHKASWEADAERAIAPAAKRALWLQAARHWRTLMRECGAVGDAKRYWRAYKFARIAISAARYA